VIVFKKVKKTQQASINQCTVIQSYFCCNIHYGRDALNYFGSQQFTEFSQQSAILNPTHSHFKYLSDFGFLKKWRIPLDSDSESVRFLKLRHHFSTDCLIVVHDSNAVVISFARENSSQNNGVVVRLNLTTSALHVQ